MNGWLSDDVCTRAGVLLGPARAFAERSLAAELHGFGAPDLAVRALARRMRSFVCEDDVTDEDERRFIEGAGALLGLLLCASLRARHAERAGRHLVALGAHGFFDPFQAIDRSLSAEDVRAELAAALREAEREAHGVGPLSRAVSLFRRRIAIERPELAWAGQFCAELTLLTPDDAPITVDLAEVVAATREASEASLLHNIDRMIAMLPGARAEAGCFADVRAALFPRVTHRDQLAELCARAGAELAAVPLVGELVVALIVEQRGRARYLRCAELAGWQVGAQEALAVAKENLARASARTRVMREDTDDGPLYMLRSGDGRDSARVLLEELLHPLAERVGPHALVSVPHRDVLFACDGRIAPLVARLRERTEADAARAPHRVSSALYVLDARGLTPFAGPSRAHTTSPGA